MLRQSNNNTTVSSQYSVLIFAANKKKYVQFALNCARSILLHNNIFIYIASNIDFDVPKRLKNSISHIPLKPEHADLGIGMKLHADEYLQTRFTLFVDSDCLCYGDLNDIFKACGNMDVSVAGRIVPVNDWTGRDVAQSIKDNFGLEELIRFNGGLYFIQDTPNTKKIFREAREIAEQYDYGLDAEKRWIMEEPLISIGMLINNQSPISDDGSFMTDLFTDSHPRRLNVLYGKRLLFNPVSNRYNYRGWFPTQYSPIILHFGGRRIAAYPYVSQNLQLYLYYRLNLSKLISTILAYLLIVMPFTVYYALKSAFTTFSKFERALLKNKS